MHERKARMADLSDAFMALPGGFGTLDELCEILTWAQLGIHRKPIGLLNVAGYYDHFLALLDHQVREGLLKSQHRDYLAVDDNPAAFTRKAEGRRSSRRTQVASQHLNASTLGQLMPDLDNLRDFHVCPVSLPFDASFVSRWPPHVAVSLCAQSKNGSAIEYRLRPAPTPTSTIPANRESPTRTVPAGASSFQAALPSMMASPELQHHHRTGLRDELRTSEAHTDSKGRFQLSDRRQPRRRATMPALGTMTIRIAVRSGPETSRARRPPRRWTTRLRIQTVAGVSEQALSRCELRAVYPGYRSDNLSLANRKPLDNPDIGTLILHRLGDVKGTTISVSSAMAPKPAQKAYEKAMQQAGKGDFEAAEAGFAKAVDIYPAVRLGLV